jgi:hypothetical protein
VSGKSRNNSINADGKKRRSFVALLFAAVMLNVQPRWAATDRDEGTRAMFPKHETINHFAGEYARGDVTTNTVEGFFGIFKRGLNGTYHHISSQHLERYTTDFDFRYNNRQSVGVNDVQRADKRISGERLTYRRISS